MTVRLAIIAVAVLASGCASLSTMQTARTLRPGESQITASTSLAGGGIPGIAIDTGLPPPAGHKVALPVPQAEIEVRHGFAPRWDWGIRTYLLGLGTDVKFQFLQREKWDAAFAPGTSLSYVFLPAGGSSLQTGELDVVLPVLFGRHLRGGSSVVFGPKMQGRLAFNAVNTPQGNARGTRFVLLGGAGGTLNVALGKGWSIPLELSIYNDWTEKTGVAYSAGFGLAVSTDMRPHWRTPARETTPAP